MTDFQGIRDSADAARKRIIQRARNAGREVFTDNEDTEFRRLTDVVNDADHQLAELDRRAQ